MKLEGYNHMSLADQKVVIMGGTSGIGFATAKAAVSAGGVVVITGRDADKVKRATASLPGRAEGVLVDATSADALSNFYKNLGPFDHLVLSMSGKVGGGPFKSLSVDLLKQAFAAKFFAYVTAVQASLQTLRLGGSMVLVTASSARTSYPGTSGLAAVNGALEAMIPTLALELKPTRVNAVSPGIIDTPWWDTWPQEQREAAFAKIAASTPVGRIGQPEDIAQAILLLLENSFMTGTVIECDGGIRIK
jgi:NAD(P)-dependent dehydrogenase (short-subunit alcohol dehydrogenase family)